MASFLSTAFQEKICQLRGSSFHHFVVLEWNSLLRLLLGSLFCTFLIVFVAFLKDILFLLASLDEKIFGFTNFELKFAE